MIGQILQRDIGIIDEELIVRVSGFIGEQEIAVSDIELTHADMNRRAVVLLPNLFAGLFYPLRFCLLSRWRMNVANANPVDGGIVDISASAHWSVTLPRLIFSFVSSIWNSRFQKVPWDPVRILSNSHSYWLTTDPLQCWTCARPSNWCSPQPSRCPISNVALSSRRISSVLC